MHLQEINLLLEFDDTGHTLRSYKIVPNLKESIVKDRISLIKVDNETSERIGKCNCCSSDFEIFLYQMNADIPEVVPKSEEYNEDIVIKEEIFVEEIHPEKFEICEVQINEKLTKDTKKIKKKQTFKTKKKLKTETKVIEKTEDGYWICEGCKTEFHSRKSLTNHRPFCNGIYLGKYKPGSLPQCSYCDKTYGTWNLVQLHEKKVHTQTHSYSCQFCDYITTNNKTFKEHQKTNHSDIKRPFTCDLCSYSSSTKNCMRQHIKSRHLKISAHICEICAKTFTNIGALKVHHAHKHSDERNYACKLCDKSFKTSIALNAHHYKMHLPTEKKIKFVCDVCDFFTYSKFSFTTHKGTHVDIDQCQFICRLCNQGFASKSILKGHQKTHSEERPFKCETCFKTFKRKAELTIHTRYHTGEKPYECEICGQRYSDRGCYRSHLIMHEKQLGVILDKSVKKFINKPRIISEDK